MGADVIHEHDEPFADGLYQQPVRRCGCLCLALGRRHFGAATAAVVLADVARGSPRPGLCRRLPSQGALAPPPLFALPSCAKGTDIELSFQIDAADSALKSECCSRPPLRNLPLTLPPARLSAESPSMPRVGASKLIRGKSLKRTMPTISQPQLISSTSKAGATAITITPPPPLPLPERAQTVGHSASKSMSERFKRLTGRRKSKDNLKDPSWMQDLPPSPTVGTSPRIPPSWPTSPQQQDAAAGGDAFRFPSRAATASPPASPVDPSGKKTFMGRLRPRKTLDNISTSPEPALDGRVHPHTAPLLAARQFSGPPMEGSAHSPAPASDGDGSSPAPVQRSASFKSGHSHASSVHALFDAASKLGIDAQDVDALLRRSNSASQRSNPTYDSAYLQQQQGVATPPMTRATSTRSQLAVDSIIEDQCEEQQAVDGPERRVPVSVSAQSGLSQSSAISSLSKSGSIMRRTVILPQENGRLSFQAPSPAAREAPPPPPAKAGLPRSPAKARLSAIAATLPTPDVPLPSPPHDRRPPFMTKSSLSPSERSFSRAGHSSANASLFDLYHGHDDDDEYLADGELDDARRSRALSSTSVVQPGQAIEILEMSNGDVLYSVLQGLRDIEDVEDAWDTRSDAASTMDRPPSSVMDEPVQLTFRGQRYDGPDLSRRSLFKPSKAPRPETKVRSHRPLLFAVDPTCSPADLSSPRCLSHLADLLQLVESGRRPHPRDQRRPRPGPAPVHHEQRLADVAELPSVALVQLEPPPAAERPQAVRVDQEAQPAAAAAAPAGERLGLALLGRPVHPRLRLLGLDQARPDDVVGPRPGRRRRAAQRGRQHVARRPSADGLAPHGHPLLAPPPHPPGSISSLPILQRRSSSRSTFPAHLHL